MTLRNQLIDAIREAETGGVNRRRLASTSGISEASLSRLVHGKTVTIETAEKLAKALGKNILLSGKNSLAS